jgi:glutathione S-transferase
MVIVNYFAKKCDLIPKNHIEAAYADMYANQFTDIFNVASAIALNSNSTQSTASNSTLFNVTIPLTLKRLEARIIENCCGVIAGRHISYADIFMASILDVLGKARDGVLSYYPNVKALDIKVRSKPRIAAWILKRPQTDL